MRTETLHQTCEMVGNVCLVVPSRNRFGTSLEGSLGNVESKPAPLYPSMSCRPATPVRVAFSSCSSCVTSARASGRVLA